MSKKRPPRNFKPGPFARTKSLKNATFATSRELRAFFAADKILEKLAAGELTSDVVETSHPALPLANEPFCTNSQIVEYYDLAGNAIARAHRYLRVDGSIGLSGFPDPKEILHENVLYTIDPKA